MMEIDPSDAMLLFFGIFSVLCISVAIMANNKQEHELAEKRAEQDASKDLYEARSKEKFLLEDNKALAEQNAEYLNMVKDCIKVQEETIKHLAKALKKDVVKVDNENVVGDANRMTGRDYTG